MYARLSKKQKQDWLLIFHKTKKPIPQKLLRYVEFKEISEFTLDVVYDKLKSIYDMTFWDNSRDILPKSVSE